MLVHPWDMMGAEHAQVLDAVAGRHAGGTIARHLLPDLQWHAGTPAEAEDCLAHGGDIFPYTIGRIEHGFNMRPDLVATDNPGNPRDYIKRLYFDSWVADQRALQYLLDSVGIDRVMLGTDYPFPLGEQVPGEGIAALDQDPNGRHASTTAPRWSGWACRPRASHEHRDL